jgi:hypothetical protein
MIKGSDKALIAVRPCGCIVLAVVVPAADDWFYNPVPLVSLAEKEPADILK